MLCLRDNTIGLRGTGSLHVIFISRVSRSLASSFRFGHGSKRDFQRLKADAVLGFWEAILFRLPSAVGTGLANEEDEKGSKTNFKAMRSRSDLCQVLMKIIVSAPESVLSSWRFCKTIERREHKLLENTSSHVKLLKYPWGLTSW